MNHGSLSSLPDWPALMDVETAGLYLGNKSRLLETLVDRKYLAPFTDRHRCKTFRRIDIDAALAIAKAQNDQLEPRCVRSAYDNQKTK